MKPSNFNAMKENGKSLLNKLNIADPEIAGLVVSGLQKQSSKISSSIVSMLVDDIIWALSHEHSFGRAIAEGYLNLVEKSGKDRLEKYHEMVRKAGGEGPTYGRIISECLVPVLLKGDAKFLEKFVSTVGVMKSKGVYTLQGPLTTLLSLLQADDLESAKACLTLLRTTFIQELTYSQSQHFTSVLPKALMSFASTKRVWQIKQLERVIYTNFHLADYFLDGMEKGLYLLSKEALECFVSHGLEKYQNNSRRGNKFLSLDSKLGRDVYLNMQVTVPVAQIQHQLNRYVRARTGRPISIRSLSVLSASFFKERNGNPTVRSDGQFIYLPDEISFFKTKEENVNLYKGLARLEAGIYEFNSLDFDLDKAFDKGLLKKTRYLDKGKESVSDLEFFLNSFPVKELSRDLFTIFEQGRLRHLFSYRYPGLVEKTFPMLQAEARKMQMDLEQVDAVFQLYLSIALGLPFQKNDFSDRGLIKKIISIITLFEETIGVASPVEVCAGLVEKAYRKIEDNISAVNSSYRPLQTPFDRKIRPDLYYSTYLKYDRIIRIIKVRLEKKGLRLYKSDVKKCLIQQNGKILLRDLKELVFRPDNPAGDPLQQHRKTLFDLSESELANLLGNTIDYRLQADESSSPAYWYREWSADIADYLHDHVRVLDRLVVGDQDGFYENTVKQYKGLVKRIRYSFELLKPEGLSILRQWIEGDEFDYRALLDFAMDKKAGITPSDRLYIKRIKQERDVTVMLLVDLSRSTSNSVSGLRKTVLDVEKEAIVLFCEALQVVGDSYGIAGFSGTGRFGVDFFRIKNFYDRMDESIKSRISAMAPQRSTRMGAAIRHAASQLESVSSKVRLLIIIGDGFPNDVDYKQGYAIEDTRKAIFEARSKNLYVHGITVNLAGDSRLDDLYGNVHHNVISDVKELPDKLLRIYSSLTR